MNKPRPILRYHGSKFRIAKWIVRYFPQHDLYLEPFGGSGSVLMRKERSRIEIYNDIDSEIVNLFRVLRQPTKSMELELQLRLTPFAREEYESAIEPTDCPIERARRLIVRAFQGHGADSIWRTSGFRVSTQQRQCASKDWESYWDAIPKFAQRLAGVVVENRPAMDLMRKFDRPNALYYLDPPYVMSTRNSNHKYRFEFNEKDHLDLVECAKSLRAMVIISGYDHEIYSDMGWERRETIATTDKGSKEVEVLWLNPACANALNSTTMFERLCGIE